MRAVLITTITSEFGKETRLTDRQTNTNPSLYGITVDTATVITEIYKITRSL